MADVAGVLSIGRRICEGSGRRDTCFRDSTEQGRAQASNTEFRDTSNTVDSDGFQIRFPSDPTFDDTDPPLTGQLQFDEQPSSSTNRPVYIIKKYPP